MVQKDDAPENQHDAGSGSDKVDGFGLLPGGLVRALCEARSIAVLTGAGMSAESGVPTFRDAMTGLWQRFDPRELATPEAFDRNPSLVWSWYAWRRELVARARPHAGHAALAGIEQCVPDFLLITQNVDGLHRAAGSRRLVELHGNLMRTVCSRERKEVRTFDPDASPPRCPDCGAPCRPDVVWFGESLPPDALAAADAAACRADVFLSIGTSAEVYPAAALPGRAKAAGATVVEVNPQPTPLSSTADFVLRLTAARAVPALLAAIRQPR